MSKKNKIIIFIGTMQSGGAERVISQISPAFFKYFENVEILMYYNKQVFYDVDENIKLSSIEANTNSKCLITNILWFRRYILKSKPDILLSFLLPFNIFSIWSLIFSNINIIVCDRNSPKYVPKNYLYKIIRNISYFFAVKIIVQTTKSKNYFSKKLKTKINVIPNPNYVTREERQEALFTKKNDKIVSVGRLVQHHKNHLMLIDAFYEIHKTHPQFKLYVYGEGKDRPLLENHIKLLNLSNCVFLPGVKRDIHKKIMDAKIFVMSSNYEGMPNALMEAMALGIPCVSTNVAGADDIIKNGFNGYLVDVGDKNNLEIKIIKLIEDENIRFEFSKNTEIILERYNIQSVFHLWNDAVNTL